MTNAEKIAHLLHLRLQGSLDDSQQEELDSFLQNSPATRRLADRLNNPADVQELLTNYSLVTNRRRSNPLSIKAEQSRKSILVRLDPGRWFRYAAAIILLAAGATGYYWNMHKKELSRDPAGSLTTATDIQPAKETAVLVLSSGQEILLTDSTAATIYDGAMPIVHENGEVSYQNATVASVNTMRTPKGGQYKLVLSDGSKVWLNAASSITFPTAFNEPVRKVVIKGEVYFEIANNKTKPFLIVTEKDSIEVLGTKLNVNAYSDEPAMKTSLVEGAVKVNQVILRPGQAYINGKLVSTNIAQDLAWKNQLFDFDGADLPAVMRQIARWYDVDVKYDGAIPALRFQGQIQRKLSLSQVLKVLEAMHIRFRLEGRTIYILPALKK